MDTLPFPTDAIPFLLWLATPVAAGIAFSTLFERSKAFQALPGALKHYFVLGFFTLLPLVTTLGLIALGAGPAALPATPQAWVAYVLTLLLQGLSAWSASQYAHKYDIEGAQPKAF